MFIRLAEVLKNDEPTRFSDAHVVRVQTQSFRSGGSPNLAHAFDSESPSEKTVRCWLAKFSSDHFDLEQKPGRGRRMLLDDQALRAAVESKPDTTTRALAADLGVHHTTVVKHLASIAMIRKIQRWTSQDLT
ncbi:hypothetical protein Y032_0714g1763 [Ancylostoma ceylanicum]|uniref:Mos1 transposase HTH domain-containing protein n=1 Tax=Ancylostoma ceylanicum TaxID=53326 RepID=A0A016WGT8_9BILA|nr:hypothetical protein Y032_0714g1763 [Ancylostoma ceylanicum]